MRKSKGLDKMFKTQLNCAPYVAPSDLKEIQHLVRAFNKIRVRTVFSMLKLIWRKTFNLFHHYFSLLWFHRLHEKLVLVTCNKFHFFFLFSSPLFYVIWFHIKNSKSICCTAFLIRGNPDEQAHLEKRVSKIDSLSRIKIPWMQGSKMKARVSR